VGLATALALRAADRTLRVTVLEKEPGPGRHQSSHNSGVIHSGIYYRPGSLKARLCVSGAAMMFEFCREHRVAHERCGKLIVATSPAEVGGLAELEARAAANGVIGVRRIGPAEIAALEPAVAGVAALHVAATGITDYPAVVAALVRQLTADGVRLLCGAEVLAARRAGSALRLQTRAGPLEAGRVINCAGLHADVVAVRCGHRPPVRVVPFRGEYYLVRPERAAVRGLVYPLPDARFPFLGVHFTRTVHGLFEAGPNAVLALARQGYGRGDVDPAHLAALLGYAGFRRLAARYWRPALGEYHRSLRKAAFVTALRRLAPGLRGSDLVFGGAGVRAQAVAPDGRLVDDFSLIRDDRAIHVLNAPSPGATAALAIGRHLAALALSG